jgi:tetratricopeptide (TPR) repeat protein
MTKTGEGAREATQLGHRIAASRRSGLDASGLSCGTLGVGLRGAVEVGECAQKLRMLGMSWSFGLQFHATLRTFQRSEIETKSRLKMINAKVFLSLSGTDAPFVRRVYEKLPRGVAHFYEKSFENGLALTEQMRKCVNESAIFVLFASRAALKSNPVQYEISLAKIQQAKSEKHRILIFKVSDDVSIEDFPDWMTSFFIDSHTYNENDIARIITDELLNLISGNDSVGITVGRGGDVDNLVLEVSNHLVEMGGTPNIFYIYGLNGIGRRTFLREFISKVRSVLPNLRHGPVIALPEHASLFDLFRSLYVDANPSTGPEALAAIFDNFRAANQDQQVQKLIESASHFSRIGQAVTIVSSNGFHEESGEIKTWVRDFVKAVPQEQFVFIVSNRQIRFEELSELPGVISYRVPEITDGNVQSLMQLSATAAGVKNFKVSKDLIKSIGGHPGLAKSTVRLAKAKGAYILERDPSQIFRIQDSIIGEIIQPENLSGTELRILNILGWLPSLGGDLLELIACDDGSIDSAEFLASLESLRESCLIVPVENEFHISPSVRMAFRRRNPTPPELIQSMSSVLKSEWDQRAAAGEFREDLFDAFIYMHALEGKSLPKEFRVLLGPATLLDVIKQSYAFGREEEAKEAFERVVKWGESASEMQMDDSAREDLMATVTRSHIRLRQYREAEDVAKRMAAYGFRSVNFLRGYSLRKQKKYTEAIPYLEQAIKVRKQMRASVHELALCYKNTNSNRKLSAIISQHEDMFSDSALFVDFKVGVFLSKGQIQDAEDAIGQLDKLADAGSLADRRRVQIFMRTGQYPEAKALIEKIIKWNGEDNFRNRALLAEILAHSGDLDAAERELKSLVRFVGRQDDSERVRAIVYLAAGKPKRALEVLERIDERSGSDQILLARIYDALSREEQDISKSEALRRDAARLRAEYGFDFDFDE